MSRRNRKTKHQTIRDLNKPLESLLLGICSIRRFHHGLVEVQEYIYIYCVQPLRQSDEVKEYYNLKPNGRNHSGFKAPEQYGQNTHTN